MVNATMSRHCLPMRSFAVDVLPPFLLAVAAVTAVAAPAVAVVAVDPVAVARITLPTFTVTMPQTRKEQQMEQSWHRLQSHG
jgi:hypothetical protein